jgi:hypothetical protein
MFSSSVQSALPAVCLSTLLAPVHAKAQQKSILFDAGGGGAGSCSMCYMNQYGGSISIYCAAPQSGQGGYQNCRIESYPEGTYCFLDGNECCVD